MTEKLKELLDEDDEIQTIILSTLITALKSMAPTKVGKNPQIMAAVTAKLGVSLLHELAPNIEQFEEFMRGLMDEVIEEGTEDTDSRSVH